MLARCGLDCSACYAYSQDCSGCNAVDGKPFWTREVGIEQCELYRCSVTKNYAHCGHCQELPCKMWYDLKDPPLSDEQHQENIQERVRRLRQN
ncbi:MAG: DUF3795 domain-containing protein [Firmicutes bacterium]|nr:DUF3795 domain-containing protein [Bacillota bacterium]